MIRSLFVSLVISILVTSTPATTTAQTATPVPQPLAACSVTPRTPEELDALLGDDYEPPAATPLVVEATPGGELEFGIDALPDGTPTDGTEVEAVVQEAYSCLAAGDYLRHLALYTDEKILSTRSLGRLGMVMATPAFQTPTPQEHGGQMLTVGLFHTRLLPDGRIAAVTPPGAMGLPVLYLFERVNGRWLIDETLVVGSPYASSGEARTTFTGAYYTATESLDLMSYGWGLEFGPEWKPVINQENEFDSSVAALTDGESFVLAGVPNAASDGDLAGCVQLESKELISSLRDVGLKEFAAAVKHGLYPVPITDDTLLQGVDEQRAVAVYELAASADEQVATGGPLRLYVECRTMADGAWILGITQIVPAADYEAEATRRDELLASLED
jgi:hypothetical protein